MEFQKQYIVEPLNDMEKYFNQKMISWLDVVLASIAVGGWAFSSFVWGGGRIGIPIFVAAAAVLGAKRSMRIKDSELDGALAKMLSENGIDVEDENTVFSFDYQSRLVYPTW